MTKVVKKFKVLYMKSVVTKRKENTMGYKDEEIMAEKKAAALKKIQELEGIHL